MANHDDLQNTSRYLASVMREMANAANMFSKLSEELSSAGLDKFAAKMKETLKLQGLINDADYKSIETAKDLHKVLAELEEQSEKITKLEKERAKASDELVYWEEKRSKASSEEKKVISERMRGLRTTMLEADKELGKYTAEQRRAHTEGMRVVRENIRETERQTGSFKRLGKEVDSVTGGFKSQAQAFFHLSTSMALVTRAANTTYEQLTRLSEKGLVNVFMTLNQSAWKLGTTVENIEQMVSNNRDVIAKMGGGVKAVESFTDEIKRIKQEFMYLGKNASVGAERIFRLNKNLGLIESETRGISYADYDKSIKEMAKQQREFSGLFGDTVEEYAALYEAQANETIVREQLNNLQGSSLIRYRQEMMERTRNLKLMGLQNEQIVEFNKKVAETLDPRKDNRTQRVSEAAYARNELFALRDALLQSGNESSIAVAKNMEKHIANAEKLMNAYSDSSVSAADFAKMQSQPEMIEAMKAMEKMRGEMQNLPEGLKAAASRYLEKTGSFGANVIDKTKDLNTAEAQNKNQYSKIESENLAKLEAAAKQATGAAEDTFMNWGLINEILSDIYGLLHNLKENVISQFVLAIGSVVGLLAGLAMGFRRFYGLLSKIPGLGRIFGNGKLPGSGGTVPPKGPTVPPVGAGPAAPGPAAPSGTPKGGYHDPYKVPVPGTQPPSPPGTGAPPKPAPGPTTGKAASMGSKVLSGASKISKLTRFARITPAGLLLGLGLDALIGAASSMLSDSKEENSAKQDDFWDNQDKRWEDLLDSWKNDVSNLIGRSTATPQQKSIWPQKQEALSKQSGEKTAPVGGQPRSTRTKEDFVKEYGPYAERAAKELNVPKEAVLAQWGLETGWGKSIIPGTNNLGNIKDFRKNNNGVSAKDNMNGSVDKYRKYESTDAFVDDYVRLLKNRRYSAAGVAGSQTTEEFATALKRAGYAEDPNYISSMVRSAKGIPGMTTGPVLAKAQPAPTGPRDSKAIADARGASGDWNTDSSPVMVDKLGSPAYQDSQRWKELARVAQGTGGMKVAEKPINPSLTPPTQSQVQDSILIKKRTLGPEPGSITPPPLATPSFNPKSPITLSLNSSNFNTPSAKTIAPVNNNAMKDSTQVAEQAQKTGPEPIDPNEELKRQTELLAAIVRNTMPGRLSSAHGVYQEDRSRYLNGLG